MSIPTMERELRLMIKTLTHLGYSEWTSISDDEVRSGSPRVYCSFLRFLLDAHPRVLHDLLTPPPSPLPQQQKLAGSSALGAARENVYGPRPGQPQRSSINKHIAVTFGFHAPPSSGSSSNNGGGGGPKFIVETDDGRFMQRLLQYVLPDVFAVAPPMTPQQFFRASGGFVLHKAKLVRNVAALFQRREAELLKREQNAQQSAGMLERMAAAHRRRLEYYHAEENSALVDPAEVLARGLQPPSLLDEHRPGCFLVNSDSERGVPEAGTHPELQTHLTARQRALLHEQRSKAVLQQRLAELGRQHRGMNHFAREEAHPDVQLRRTHAHESPLTLVSSAGLAVHPNRNRGAAAAASSSAAIENAASVEVRSGSVGRDGDIVAICAPGVGAVSAAQNIILYDQARHREAAPDEELVEELIMPPPQQPAQQSVVAGQRQYSL